MRDVPGTLGHLAFFRIFILFWRNEVSPGASSQHLRGDTQSRAGGNRTSKICRKNFSTWSLKLVEIFYLKVENFYLQVENFYLQVENFYLQVENCYLLVENCYHW